MKEINFMAWDKTNKQMLVVRDIRDMHLKIGVWKFKCENKSYEDIYPYSKQLEIMQFTGIKDKNGKKIFEGDILMITTWLKTKKKGLVEFDRGSFVVNGEPLSNWLDIEKIGNKFENPKLLKENKNETKR